MGRGNTATDLSGAMMGTLGTGDPGETGTSRTIGLLFFLLLLFFSVSLLLMSLWLRLMLLRLLLLDVWKR